MSQNYDNWERLVRVVLRRDHDRELARCHSIDTSIDSSSSSLSTSQFDFHHSSVPMDYSDLVLDHQAWKAMLPRGEREILYKSASMRFFLDRWTRKNCFLLGAMSLSFSEENWYLKTHEKSRFTEVIVPKGTSQDLDICCLISMQMLSPNTVYAGYLVFGLANNGTTPSLVNSSIQISSFGSNCEVYQRSVDLFEVWEDRHDGWKEIELGVFCVDEGIKAEVVARIVYSSGSWLKHLIVEGIEFRPLKSPSQLPQMRITTTQLPQMRITTTCHDVSPIETLIDSWHFNKGR